MKWEEINELLEVLRGAYEVGQFTFTTWEEEFYDSVSQQFSNTDTLSDKQVDVLKKMVERIG